MPAKQVRIEDLQPTDTLRQETVSFLETLTPEQIKGLGMPQVWETSSGLLISDGNHRAAVLAQQGANSIEVDYNPAKNIPEYLQEFLTEIIKRAKNLTSKSIYSVYDLWQA